MSNGNSTGLPVGRSKISGHVNSADGAILNGAHVVCRRVETKTLADGSFLLDGLDPGRYEVTVTLQGFKPASRVVSIQEGEETTLDFSLCRATGTAKIRGHVYDAESKRTVEEGGTVVLILPVANRYRHIDRHGYYEFENLPAGTYRMLTSIPGRQDRHVTLTVAHDEVKTHDFFCKTQETEEPPWG
jgi:hypothetical protein